MHPKGAAVTTALQPLTARQKRILDFIRYRRDTGSTPPTVRELGDRFGIASTEGVMCHLRALEKKGYITCNGLSRGIRLTEKRRCPHCGGEID